MKGRILIYYTYYFQNMHQDLVLGAKEFYVEHSSIITASSTSQRKTWLGTYSE